MADWSTEAQNKRDRKEKKVTVIETEVTSQSSTNQRRKRQKKGSYLTSHGLDPSDQYSTIRQTESRQEQTEMHDWTVCQKLTIGHRNGRQRHMLEQTLGN